MILITNTLIDGLKERIANAVSTNQSTGIIIPSNNYSDLICSLFEYMDTKPDAIWVYLTITKPFESIFDDYSSLINNQNIIFIDCISHAAGISKEKSNCIYIESPSQLESILLEIMNSYKNTDDKKNKYLGLIGNNAKYQDNRYQHIKWFLVFYIKFFEAQVGY